MEIFQKVTLAFTIIGALNWGLIGLFDFNLVTSLFSNDGLINLTYILIAICGIINIGLYFYHLENE